MHTNYSRFIHNEDLILLQNKDFNPGIEYNDIKICISKNAPLCRVLQFRSPLYFHETGSFSQNLQRFAFCENILFYSICTYI